MSTLRLIITKIVQPNIDFFLPEYKLDGANGAIRVYFGMLLSSDLSIKQQYKFFKDSLTGFLMIGNESIFTEYFYKIKKTYNVLNRLAYMYKYNRSKIVADRDLCLNELKITDPNVICVYQDNAKYLFHINDIISIIDTSLTNTYMFFSEPKPIKNPYNNLPFNKSTLYNIYFFIKFKTRLFPELMIKFYDSDFNLSEFKYKNEYLLRDYIIHNFVYKSSHDVITREIYIMIEGYNSYCKTQNLKNKIKIDDSFPTNTLIKIFQPYLMLYIKSKYAHLDHVKDYNLYALKTSLLKFQKFNPLFGRKTYRIQYKDTSDFKRKICGRVTVFNDSHVRFTDVDNMTREFLNDHLVCRERGVVLDEPPNIARYLILAMNMGGNMNRDDANGDDANGDDANGDDANGDDANGDDANGDDANGDDMTIDMAEYDDIGSNINNNVYAGNNMVLPREDEDEDEDEDEEEDEASDAGDTIEDIYNTTNNLNMDVDYNYGDEDDDEYEDESVS